MLDTEDIYDCHVSTSLVSWNSTSRNSVSSVSGFNRKEDAEMIILDNEKEASKWHNLGRIRKFGKCPRCGRPGVKTRYMKGQGGTVHSMERNLFGLLVTVDYCAWKED